MISPMTTKKSYLQQELDETLREIKYTKTVMNNAVREEDKEFLNKEMDRLIKYKERLEKELRGEALMTNEEVYKVANMITEHVTDIIDRNLYVKIRAIHDLKNIQYDMKHCLIDLSNYVAEIEKVIQKLDGGYECEYETNEVDRV